MPVCGHSYQPWQRIVAFKSPMTLVYVDGCFQGKVLDWRVKVGIGLS